MKGQIRKMTTPEKEKYLIKDNCEKEQLEKDNSEKEESGR